MAEGRAEVEILGQRIAVRGRGSPEYIRGLAEYLDRMIRTVREEARIQDPTRLTVLAGLHLVDELFRLREREAGLTARVDALIDRLDGTLRPEPRGSEPRR
jgi:cell division protein ZapA (FtsZ GTPase activity inhibitor)